MLFSLKKRILLFQEIELPDPKNVKEERALVVWNSRLANYFKSSPCYLEEIVSKGKHGTLRPLFQYLVYQISRSIKEIRDFLFCLRLWILTRYYWCYDSYSHLLLPICCKLCMVYLLVSTDEVSYFFLSFKCSNFNQAEEEMHARTHTHTIIPRRLLSG